MIKLLLAYILFPIILYSSNIGLCGGKFFPERQKMIDNLVLQFKIADKNNKGIYKNRIEEEFGNVGIENLIRYKEEVLNEVFYDLLVNEDFYVKYKSIYALRYSKNLDHKTLLSFLNSENIYLKDMAISTLVEAGDKKLLPVLKQYVEKETNIYIKNSLEYAVNKIDKGSSQIFPDFDHELEKGKLIKFKYYKMGNKIDGYEEKFSQIFLQNTDFPESFSFIPLIIGYKEEFIFKGQRTSFGVGGGEVKHVGDDCGWFREGASVHAIGNGIIRLIHHSPDWGFLIVIEHKLENKEYLCSVYGHLSKEIYLKAGHTVKKGDKIGTIGLSYSVENGGYGAHLHFGISKGPWLKSRYNFGQNISVEYDNKVQRVKEYRLTEKGVELIFENGLIVKLEELQNSVNNYLFWLKGYEFSRDVDRLWLDPQEFLRDHKDKE